MEKNLTIINRSLDDIAVLSRQKDNCLDWNLVFTLPAWLKVWWKNFGSGSDLLLCQVNQNNSPVGIAPLQIRDKTAFFIGNIDVCDYQDFIICPGQGDGVFGVLLDELARRGINEIHLETVRPDSTVITQLTPFAQSRGCRTAVLPSDVSSDLELPSNWDAYLAALDGKQRHEIKRKIRNLSNLGRVEYYNVSAKQQIPETLEKFLKLFPESRGDKAAFMTSEMQNYFRDLTLALAEEGVVRFGVLEFEETPVAMVMYFDYNDNMYLYNSAYDPEYRSLSVGIISKTNCIREGIEQGKKRFDFLKGSEVYKSHLGGQTIQLYSCHINL